MILKVDFASIVKNTSNELFDLDNTFNLSLLQTRRKKYFILARTLYFYCKPTNKINIVTYALFFLKINASIKNYFSFQRTQKR
jgi:hypothetical protein